MRAARFGALLRKELIQFLRARGMLVFILYLFTGEVLTCTYAMSFDVRNLPTAVADFDRSAASRGLLQAFAASGYFRLLHATTQKDQIAHQLDGGEALAAIVIPPGFERGIALGKPGAVQLLLDGSNSNAATIARGYAQSVVHSFLMQRAAPGVAPPVVHVPRVWYNSELDYRYFMVLSGIALAGMMVGVITAAGSAVREKESGTIEQLLVTPATSPEVIAAKCAPPLFMALVSLFPSLLIAQFIGVPLRGSLPLFIVFSMLFVLSSLGIGLLVATFCDTLQQALLVSFLVLFPVLFLSGTLVPLESMPVALQYASELSPLRHYMEALLALFLKGVGLDVLWPRLVATLLIGAALLGLGVARFRRRLG